MYFCIFQFFGIAFSCLVVSSVWAGWRGVFIHMHLTVLSCLSCGCIRIHEAQACVSFQELRLLMLWMLLVLCLLMW